MPRIRLLLLDDHILFREGLVRLLETEPDFDTVGQCGSFDEALSVLARMPVDIVLLDFELENDVGLRLLGASRDGGYRHKTLMVTAGMNPIDTSRAMNMGISGIFLKHSSPAMLLEAIRAVAAGQIWMDPKISQSEPEKPGAKPAVRHLTEREQEVLRSVFEGLSNKEIAYKIGVSQSSVKATLQQLFEKTGVRTRSQLVRIAIERSLEAS